MTPTLDGVTPRITVGQRRALVQIQRCYRPVENFWMMLNSVEPIADGAGAIALTLPGGSYTIIEPDGTVSGDFE